MKANELRMDNWVLRKDGVQIQLLPQDIVGQHQCDIIKKEEFKPIKLTEEWLIKFGFDDSEYKKGYIGKEYRSNLITDFVLTKPLFMGEFQKHYAFELRSHKYKECEYVHQLQNLYFVLTGQELKVLKRSDRGNVLVDQSDKKDDNKTTNPQ